MRYLQKSNNTLNTNCSAVRLYDCCLLRASCVEKTKHLEPLAFHLLHPLPSTQGWASCLLIYKTSNCSSIYLFLFMILQKTEVAEPLSLSSPHHPSLLHQMLQCIIGTRTHPTADCFFFVFLPPKRFQCWIGVPNSEPIFFLLWPPKHWLQPWKWEITAARTNWQQGFGDQPEGLNCCERHV